MNHPIHILPNLISFARLAAIWPVFYLYTRGRNAHLFVLLTIMFISDMIDGKLARALNCESRLGKFLDMLADNVLINLMLILFCIFPAPGTSLHVGIVIASIARSVFTISRAFLGYMGQTQYSTGWFGQFNAAALMFLITGNLLATKIPEFAQYYPATKYLIYIFVVLRVIQAVLGVNRGRKT